MWINSPSWDSNHELSDSKAPVLACQTASTLILCRQAFPYPRKQQLGTSHTGKEKTHMVIINWPFLFSGPMKENEAEGRIMQSSIK